MGGAAPTVAANGNVFVTAGNGSVTSPITPTTTATRYWSSRPTMALQQYFAPTSWASDNASDLDMSTGVALLGDGQVVAASKSRSVFLLNGSSLGGIGGQQAELAKACGSTFDGGAAVVGTTVYLPCRSGPIAVQVSASPAALHLLWSSSAGGGPPIVAAGLVWTIDADGVLYGLNPATGAVQEHATIGAPANHFPTPSVGAGLLLAPAANRVVAFTAPSAVAPPTSTSGTPTTGQATTTTAPPAAPGSADPWVIAAAAVVGGLVVLGGATWLLRRRRRPPGARIAIALRQALRAAADVRWGASARRRAGLRARCRPRPPPVRSTRRRPAPVSVAGASAPSRRRRRTGRAPCRPRPPRRVLEAAGPRVAAARVRPGTR